MSQRYQWICLILLGILGNLAMAGQLQDPTRPPWFQGDGPKLYTSPEVGAIVAGAGRRVAEVNGQWVRVGSLVDGWQVESISTNQVLLAKAGQTLLLSLAPTVIDTQS